VRGENAVFVKAVPRESAIGFRRHDVAVAVASYRAQGAIERNIARPEALCVQDRQGAREVDFVAVVDEEVTSSAWGRSIPSNSN
jgi:hypothetical protein